MVDFQKQINNSNKFRQAAITFQTTGRYCQYPEGTSEYFAFWEEEKRRGIEGYTADDGDFISGYNYFYLNYCPISRIVNHITKDKHGNIKVKRTTELEFPDFWDYDYYYYLSIEDAAEAGKHLCVLKSRRKGYSYKGASMACRNYYLVPYSKTFVYASNKQYLTDDGILTKAWDYMDFIDKNTAWGKKRSVNTAMRKRAGFFIKDEYGNEIEIGFKSEIIGVSLKDNPDVVRGKKATLILFEEAGSFNELSAAWQIARPSVEIDGKAFALMIAFGTGGDPTSAFDALKDMFYNPDGYNCLGFENIWDENVTDRKCGFFIPQYTNLDLRDDTGKRLFMDEDGNTLRREALQYILDERKLVIDNASNSVTVDRYVAERPITPQEAMLDFNGNIFPRKELQEQLARVRTTSALKNSKQIGDLVFSETGALKWKIKKHGDITNYPLKKDQNAAGSIVIWEHPPQEDIPNGLYIIGVDPYDHDQSSTTSLGSTFVYKRFQGFEENYDTIVAEYTGRPNTAEDYYENVRKLAIYYNAKIMYENERKGLFPYFTAKHCDYLLADQPGIINDTVGNSTVQRRKGCHMNKQIKQWGEGLIKDWLNDEREPGLKNLTFIKSEPLLEELISYNDKGNFDRCITKDTLIDTVRGRIKVQDITTDDYVLTHTGAYQKVTWLDSHMHSGNQVELKLVGDYRTLKCTDNHPILVAFTDKTKHSCRKKAINNISYLRADELTYKYQFGFVPKRKIDQRIDLPDEMLYVLGWIMSDGSIGTSSNSVVITFQKNQLECAKRCKDAIENYLSDETEYIAKNNRIFVRKETRIKEFDTYYRLIVCSKKLHSLAKWFGCEPNNKVINTEVYSKTSSRSLIPFVIGFLEGDGHQRLNINYDGYTRNGIELSTIYEDLLLQCRQILIDVGVYSSIRKVKQKHGKTQYSILISGFYINRLLNMHHSSKFVNIEIKKEVAKNIETDNGFWIPIKLLNVTKIEEPVYNFEVDQDHTYVSNGITVHNCMALMQVMIYREELYNVKVKQKKDVSKNRVLFDGPIFTQEWFRDDGSHEDNNKTYMFQI